LGQGRIGAAAQEGIARNPGAAKSMFIPMILALAFVETLVLLTFVTVFIVK
jgi:F-type H+-transporting ATPase subunit c